MVSVVSCWSNVTPLVSWRGGWDPTALQGWLGAQQYACLPAAEGLWWSLRPTSVFKKYKCVVSSRVVKSKRDPAPYNLFSQNGDLLVDWCVISSAPADWKDTDVCKLASPRLLTFSCCAFWEVCLPLSSGCKARWPFLCEHKDWELNKPVATCVSIRQHSILISCP